MTVTLSRAGLHAGSGCGRLARLLKRVRRRRIDDTQIH